MGEMAGWDIEQGLDQGWSPVGDPYRSGYRAALSVRDCGYCGQACTWRAVGLGWKLYEGSQPHCCKKRAASPDDFDVVIDPTGNDLA